MSLRASKRKILGVSTRTLIRAGLVVVALSGVAWLAAWLTERSFVSPNKKRAMQSWLDENLNADVNLEGGMRVRLNLVRRSRVALHGVEIEHPNPIFLGKLAVIGALGAWSPPWAVARLWPGRLDVLLRNARLFIEENESGEWNIDGLMQPLASASNAFPLPMPKISNWLAEFSDSLLSIKRNGYVLDVDLLAQVSGNPASDSITVRPEKMPFSFSAVDGDRKKSGTIGPGRVSARFGGDSRESWHLNPGRCELAVDGLPAEILPFLFPGIPLEDVPGTFVGKISMKEATESAGLLRLDGELRDVPLAVFGLPRDALVALAWPIGPKKDGTTATLRMGPAGYGAFSIAVPLDERGNPKLLSMRGDVAALDDLPALLAAHSRWPDWLSRSFPSIEWRTGKWLGFGWAGDDMRLNLARSTAGLNLTGEAGMMGGRVRVALTPERHDAPITVAAEKLDAQLFGLKLSQLLPGPFKAQVSGVNANFTWQGRRSVGGAIAEWNSGMVFAKPTMDLRGSGEWWNGLNNIVKAVAAALPEWGGGDASALLEMSERGLIALDQLSLVMDKDEDGLFTAEFRAFSEASGQATGWIEHHPDGYTEGEMFLAGDSEMLRHVREINPEFGGALTILADDSLGLRVIFRLAPGEAPTFNFPFLEEAKLIREVLDGADGGEGAAP